jgi:tetratricopeptide (TPR) repeat protein
MHTNLEAAEAEFRQWFTGGMEEGSLHARTVVSLPADERERWLDTHSDAWNYHTALDLVRQAPAVQGRDPLDAVALTGLIVRHLDRVPESDESSVVQLLLRLHAWRERGNALRNIGEFDAAGRAFETGLAIASRNPALIPEAAVLRRGLGLLMHHAGDREGALAVLREVAAIFRAIHDRAQLLRTRIIEGFIEYNSDHDSVALEIFEETLLLSRELGDEATAARSHTNAAHSARRLGFRGRALAHFASAAEMLQRCGLTAETIRAEWGLTLLQAGDDPAAILPALDRIREQFLATGRKTDAAWVSLDVVMLLGDAGRDEESNRLAISLVEFFARVGLPAEAMRALEELRDAAAEGRMSKELLEEIQERLRKV